MVTRYPEDARYSRVAMWLHWLIAFFIFCVGLQIATSGAKALFA